MSPFGPLQTGPWSTGLHGFVCRLYPTRSFFPYSSILYIHVSSPQFPNPCCSRHGRLGIALRSVVADSVHDSILCLCVLFMVALNNYFLLFLFFFFFFFLESTSVDV